VDTSTDEEDPGRPSTSGGKSAAYRYSTLKRAADDDDDAGPSSTTSEFVTTHTEASQPPLTPGIVLQNRFACLRMRYSLMTQWLRSAEKAA